MKITEQKLREIIREQLVSLDEGVKDYPVGPKLKDFDGMDFNNAQYVISDDEDYHDAVDSDDWKPLLKIISKSKYNQKLRKHLIASDKDKENFAKWLSSGEHMKSESVTNEADTSAEKALKTIPAVLAWDIEQFLNKQKDAKKLNKGSFTDLVQTLHSRGFADRLNGANLKNFQALVKNHINEGAPKMRKNLEAENIQDLMNRVANAQKGGGSGRYGKEFDKAKTKALRAIKDMLTYSQIGI